MSPWWPSDVIYSKHAFENLFKCVEKSIAQKGAEKVIHLSLDYQPGVTEIS